MSPVHLSNDELVSSFHRFIFADEAGRAPYIYGLEIAGIRRQYSLGPLDSRLRDMQERLVAILEAAAHLEYIYFLTTVDLDPVLSAAAKLVTLRELNIVFTTLNPDSKSPWMLLGTFRSPLRSLRIESDYDSADEAFPVGSIHDHLATFAPTLVVLEVHSIDFNDFPTPVTTQFTALRSFTTGTVFNFDQSTMEVLLQLFPNLDDALDLGFLGARDMEHDLPTLREGSKEVQQARTWSRLDRVSCDVQLAFLMALQCPIRRLRVTDFRIFGRGLLEPVLRDSCPRILHISLQFVDNLDDLDDLFPGSERVDALTHLVIFFNVEVRGRRQGMPATIPWGHFRDKLIDTVKHLHLTHLRIVLRFAVWKDIMAAPSAIQEQYTMYTADEADLHTIATCVFDAMPTVRNVFLTTCGHTYRESHSSEAHPLADDLRTLKKWYISKAWSRSVTGSLAESHPHSDAKTVTSPVALCEEAAENIITQEDLYLAQDEDILVQQCGDVTATSAD